MENPFLKSIRDRMERKLRDPAQQRLVANMVMSAFMRLRKKPLPDLDKRIEKFQQDVEEMVKRISVRITEDGVVVRAVGSSDALLSEIRRGSDWYEPEPEIDNIIVAAVLVSPKRT